MMSRVEENERMINNLYQGDATCTYERGHLIAQFQITHILGDISKSLAVIADEFVGDTKDLDQRIRPTGSWVHKNDDFFDWLECSECGYGSDGEIKFGEGTSYCPHCGAKMERGF